VKLAYICKRVNRNTSTPIILRFGLLCSVNIC